MSHRKFWKRTESMTLAQDKRGTRLLARWRACSPDLELRCGTFSLARELPDVFAGVLGADSTRKATMMMIMKTVTPTCPPLLNGKVAQMETNVQEYKHLTNIIEVFAADGAADEQLVGRQLSKVLAVTPDTLEPILPNLLVVVKDKAHAARRSPH